jgi:hypothetical protein
MAYIERPSRRGLSDQLRLLRLEKGIAVALWSNIRKHTSLYQKITVLDIVFAFCKHCGCLGSSVESLLLAEQVHAVYPGALRRQSR